MPVGERTDGAQHRCGVAAHQQGDHSAWLTRARRPFAVVVRGNCAGFDQGASLPGKLLERRPQIGRFRALGHLHQQAQSELLMNHGLADVEHLRLISRQQGCQHRHQSGLVLAGHRHQCNLSGQSINPGVKVN